ncbi:MAG: tRNA-binding protein [Actinomycetia bacterium]|nr:tRNA-binding protein [Actinomycetes bacterium]
MTGRPTFEDFEALGFRVGTVLRAEMNDGARDPGYQLWIDLGDEEAVQSSAKITDLYKVEDLVGRQVVVVTGFEPIRVGGFRSDVLVIGALTSNGVVLVEPDTHVEPGTVIS